MFFVQFSYYVRLYDFISRVFYVFLLASHWISYHIVFLQMMSVLFAFFQSIERCFCFPVFYFPAFALVVSLALTVCACLSKYTRACVFNCLLQCAFCWFTWNVDVYWSACGLLTFQMPSIVMPIGEPSECWITICLACAIPFSCLICCLRCFCTFHVCLRWLVGISRLFFPSI